MFLFFLHPSSHISIKLNNQIQIFPPIAFVNGNNIVKDGITKFATRSANDIDNSAPSWGSEAETDINGYSADNAAGTAKAPKLVVIHAPPVTFIPKVGLIL